MLEIFPQQHLLCIFISWCFEYRPSFLPCHFRHDAVPFGVPFDIDVLHIVKIEIA